MNGDADTEVVLGLGSNMGDSVGIIRGALKLISSFLRDMRVSSLYMTAPQDYEEQPDFYNAVVAGRFSSSPESLLSLVHNVEAEFGRDRINGIYKGPRTLDVDIILFGDLCFSKKEPDLEIPHKSAKKRLFVLIPLLEIMPDAADPLSGVLFRNIAERLPDQGVRKLEEKIWK